MAEKVKLTFCHTYMLPWPQWVHTMAVFVVHVPWDNVSDIGMRHEVVWIREAMTTMCCSHTTQLTLYFCLLWQSQDIKECQKRKSIDGLGQDNLVHRDPQPTCPPNLIPWPLLSGIVILITWQKWSHTKTLVLVIQREIIKIVVKCDSVHLPYEALVRVFQTAVIIIDLSTFWDTKDAGCLSRLGHAWLHFKHVALLLCF